MKTLFSFSSRIFMNVFTILLSLFSISHSQQFTEISTNFKQLFNSDVFVGDYDNDKDLDFIIMGSNGDSSYTLLYQNNGDMNFSKSTNNFLGMVEGDVNFGDYDNDGDLDILQVGYTEDDQYVLKVYKNQMNNFEDIGLNVFALKESIAMWEDIDQDGDLDIFYAGQTYNNEAVYESYIYENIGGDNFLSKEMNFGTSITDADFGDYDSDGDSDLLIRSISGTYPSFNPKTEIFQNDNGVFTRIDADLEGVISGEIAWGDYDQDGDLDILLAGSKGVDSLDNITKVYKNHNRTFTDIGADIIGISDASVCWGDYDNDGDLDILLTGFYNESDNIADIYENKGNDIFSSVSTSFMGVWIGDAVFADFDNDSDLDVLITGDNFMGPGNITKLYRNDIDKQNTIPFPPTNLDNIVQEQDVTLSWSSGNDNETLSNGLTYNLRIGTKKGSDNILSSMADSSGYRKIVSRGNMDHSTTWTLSKLNPGTYYWSVQSVDNNFAGSKFAIEESFTFPYEAEFNTEERIGKVPYIVNFFDSSSSGTVAWEWDFENDGIIDSYKQNPTFTYFDADTFSVKLIISNGFISDTLVKPNYITTFFDSIPNLFSVVDIPNDQGGWVQVDFARSIFDSEGLLNKTVSPELYTIEINDSLGWKAAATTVAYGKSIYSILVPTTKDSTSENSGLINFRIIAGMNEGNFLSNMMIGYSVDNLMPSVPKNLAGTLTDNNYVELSWEPIRETDFRYYQVYKSYDGVSYNLINSTITNIYTDNYIDVDQKYYYSIKAVDNSGNKSEFSNVVSIVITDITKEPDIPSEFYLAQNYPNPFNPETIIQYSLLEQCKVTIIVYDILGNKVRELINSVQTQGHHQIFWNGKNELGNMVSSGIYYYKLETEKFNSTKKMLLIR